MVVEMWIVVAGLGIALVTWRVGVSRFAFLAMVHDSLPVTLVAAWAVAVYGIATREWLMVSLTVPILAVHLALIRREVMRDRAPEWVPDAARVTVALANVFINNRTPDESAATLIATGAEVLVVAERNDEFMRSFGIAGGTAAYPFRFDGTPRHRDYATAVVSRGAFLDGSEAVKVGSISLVRVGVACGTSQLGVVAVHLHAVMSWGGFRVWRREVDDLEQYLMSLPPPFVVVGDFNASRYRPAMARLRRRVNLTDAHHALGRGLAGSLKVAAHGAAARLPAFTRVDHALLSEGVHALDVANLPPSGSDHHPFVITLAVRQA